MVSPLKGKTRAQIQAQAARRRALEAQKKAQQAKGTRGKTTSRTKKAKKVKRGRVS